ncbi:MAG: DUF1795 domain-containing protein [Candidatus Thermoplasmatota archaeon]|jgi:hypothetical protein|nr:DUF1795 domain-containing protein [Candidatus Thermoplasmatota archaeon]
MKKNHLLVLGCLLCSIFITGCTQQTQPPSREYTNGLYNFSLDPPIGWQQIPNLDPSIAVQFSPANTSEVSLYIAVPFILSEGRSLSTFADQTEENLIASGVEFTILHRDWGISSQLPTYEIAYSYDQNGTTKYVKQVTLLRTRTVFLITFTAPESLVDQYLPVVNQSIETFQ